jgi:ribose transport system permease protein
MQQCIIQKILLGKHCRLLEGVTMKNMEKEGHRSRLLSSRGVGQVLTITLGWIVICIIFGLINPSFFSGRNVGNLFRQIAPILLIGIGQGLVLITGQIDLSLGSVVGMCSMFSATLMTHSVNPGVAVLIALILSVATGLLNGFLVAGCKIPPFIATLGTMSIARGLAQIVNGNYNTDSIGNNAQGFRDFFYYGKSLNVYNAIWIALLFWIVFDFIARRTVIGRHIYAVGSNIEAAKLSGINTSRSITFAYMVSGLCAGIVGLMTCATSGMGSMDAGTSYEMYAVAAAVIGGISTLGGEGLLIGTIVGAGIWGTLQNGLQFAGAPVGIRNIFIGIIVIISVSMDIIVRAGKGRAVKRKSKNKEKIKLD